MSFRVQRISILEVLEIANIRVHHIARIVYRHSKLQFGNSSAHLQWTKMRKKNCLKGYNQNTYSENNSHMEHPPKRPPQSKEFCFSIFSLMYHALNV